MFEDVIKHYPDFPKEGIDFIDVLPFLQDKKAFTEAIAEIDRCCTAHNVATVDDICRVCIEKEYGSDEVFYRRSDIAACTPTGDTIELTLLDDLLATGGTAEGIAKALNGEVIGGRRVVVKEFVFLVELPALKGRALLERMAPVHSLMSLEGVE